MKTVVNPENAKGAVAHDHDTRARLMTLLKGWMTMNDVKTVTKDPVCGMTVDPATALHAERDGKTFYFCGEHCKKKFLSTPAGTMPQDKSGGCCGSCGCGG